VPPHRGIRSEFSESSHNFRCGLRSAASPALLETRNLKAALVSPGLILLFVHIRMETHLYGAPNICFAEYLSGNPLAIPLLARIPREDLRECADQNIIPGFFQHL